jgi:hypothetical protein
MLIEGGAVWGWGQGLCAKSRFDRISLAVWQPLHAIIMILERLQHQNKSSVIRLQEPSQPPIQWVPVVFSPAVQPQLIMISTMYHTKCKTEI